MTSVSQLVLKMCPFSWSAVLELAKIVDASIEDNGDGAVLVVHRLASASWIDDCETSMAERDAGRHEIAFAIWSTMAQAVGHADD